MNSRRRPSRQHRPRRRRMGGRCQELGIKAEGRGCSRLGDGGPLLLRSYVISFGIVVSGRGRHPGVQSQVCISGVHLRCAAQWLAFLHLTQEDLPDSRHRHDGPVGDAPCATSGHRTKAPFFLPAWTLGSRWAGQRSW